MKRPQKKPLTETTSRLRVGDTVIVLNGVDKGETGQIIAIDHVKNKVLVEGINSKTKHLKPNQSNSEAGIVSKTCPLAISNVKYYLEDAKKETKLGYKFENATEKSGMQGKKSKKIKVRYAKATGKVIPNKAVVSSKTS